jgi:hypothetical protein
MYDTQPDSVVIVPILVSRLFHFFCSGLDVDLIVDYDIPIVK